MDGELEEEYAKLREDPYFPEKLPKISNLIAVLDVITELISKIILRINPKDYENNQMNLMKKILKRLKLNILKDERMFIANHYKKALSQVTCGKFLRI